MTAGHPCPHTTSVPPGAHACNVTALMSPAAPARHDNPGTAGRRHSGPVPSPPGARGSTHPVGAKLVRAGAVHARSCSPGAAPGPAPSAAGGGAAAAAAATATADGAPGRARRLPALPGGPAPPRPGQWGRRNVSPARTGTAAPGLRPAHGPLPAAPGPRAGHHPGTAGPGGIRVPGGGTANTGVPQPSMPLREGGQLRYRAPTGAPRSAPPATGLPELGWVLQEGREE